MSAKNLSTVTTELIESYGKTARNVIHAYRMGNQRVARYVDQRWEKALERSASELRNGARKNAQAAQKSVSGLYLKGVTLTSDGADGVVSKVVEIAGKGVRQWSVNASRFEQRTGWSTLDDLARVAVPAAQAVTSLAEKIEQRSGELANALAGHPAAAKVGAVKRVTPRKKATPARKSAARKTSTTRKSRKAA